MVDPMTAICKIFNKRKELSNEERVKENHTGMDAVRAENVGAEKAGR